MATPFDTAAVTIDTATENQLLKAIKPMLADRDWRSGPENYVTRCAMIATALNVATDGTGDVALDTAAFLTTAGAKPLTKQGASKLIEWLGSLPFTRTTTATASGELEDGFYEFPDGPIAKVQHAVHGSGNQYAKLLNTETGKFEFVPGLIGRVRREATLLPLERAAELGKLYGICICCGRTLTDETSIANGIGPICQAKWF